MQPQRAPLTTPDIVDVCRSLLVEGGQEAVVVREVARRLGVTAPALYKYAAGRDGLLTLLIAACFSDVADVCEEARDRCDPDDFVGQLMTTSLAFRDWGVSHRPEFGLIYGTPIAGYSAPEDGPTEEGSQRFGAVFAGIYLGLLQAERLRLPDAGSLPDDLVAALDATPQPGEHRLPPEAAYLFAVGWVRLLGLVSVEVAGHLAWVMDDSSSFVRGQLEALVVEMVV